MLIFVFRAGIERRGYAGASTDDAIHMYVRHPLIFDSHSWAEVEGISGLVATIGDQTWKTHPKFSEWSNHIFEQKWKEVIVQRQPEDTMYQTDFGEFGQGAQGILPESVRLVRFFSFMMPCVLISEHVLRICWVLGESAQMISTLWDLDWSLCRDFACLDQFKCLMCTLEMGHSRNFLCTTVRFVLFLPSFTMPCVLFSANI